MSALPRVVSLGILVALGSVPALAQISLPLEARVEPVGLYPRTGAPLTIEVSLDWGRPEIVHGRLEIELLSLGRILTRQRSAELTLRGGMQSYWFQTPVFGDYRPREDLFVRLRFARAGGDLTELGETLLFTRSDIARAFTIGFVNSRKWDTGLVSLATELRLERLFPRDDGQPSPMATSIVAWPPEKLPTLSIAYTSFDLLVLAGDGFSDLDPRQRAAVAGWVRGGGRLVIVVAPECRREHVGWINEVVDSSGRRTPLNFRSGPRRGPDLPFSGVGLYAVGVGRLVVILENASILEQPDGIAFRDAAAFLWKIQRKEAPSPAGVAPRPRRVEEYGSARGARRHLRFPDPDSMRPGALTTEDFVDLLLPKSVQVIPRGTVIVLLLIFLAAIGPLDYWVLGAFGKRTLTWLLFPVTSLGFTALTVVLSGWATGSATTRNALLIVDLGEHGSRVRENRFAAIFSASSGIDRTPVRDGVLTPLRSRYDYGRGFDPNALPVYEGRLPASYTVEEKTFQWSPRLHRCLTFETSRVESDGWSEAARLAVDWRAVARTVTPIAGPSGDVDAPGSVLKELLFGDAPFRGEIFLVTSRGCRRLFGREPVIERSFVRALSAPGRGQEHPAGAVMSHLSPHGGTSLEDLFLIDESDPKSWLLAVALRVGSDVVLYRWLRRGDD